MSTIARGLLIAISLAFALFVLAGIGMGVLFMANAKSAIHEIEAGISFLVATVALVGVASSVAGFGIITAIEDKRDDAPESVPASGYYG